MSANTKIEWADSLQHTDDDAVDRFAVAMKTKLAAARAKGRSGWDDQERCRSEQLAKMLIEHLPKGDPIDIANFAMMIHQRDAMDIQNMHISNDGKGETVLGYTAKYEGVFDFVRHLRRQRLFSESTFGPGLRTVGVVDHIRKELIEVVENPTDLTEWIDVVILALDGAWRCGATPEQIVATLVAKQTRNECRHWPDWRTSAPDKAIEHIRTEGDTQ